MSHNRKPARHNRWVFVSGFPKNERGNIDRDEENALKKLAAHLLSLSAQAVAATVQPLPARIDMS